MTLKKQFPPLDGSGEPKTVASHQSGTPATVMFGVKAREIARQKPPDSCDGLCDWLDHVLPPDVLLRLRARASDPVLIDPAPLVRLAFAAAISYETFASLATRDHTTFRRAVGLASLPLMDTWLEIARALWEESEAKAR